MTATHQRERRAAHSTTVQTLFNYAGMAAAFLTVPLLLRWLGRADYGLMLTALAFMNYLSFADAGLNWGSIVLLSEAHGRGDRAASAAIFRHSVALSVASGALALLAAGACLLAARAGLPLPVLAAGATAEQLVGIVALQCVVGLFFNTIYAVFQSEQAGHLAAFYQGLGRLVGTVGSVVAAAWTHSAAATLAANVVASVLCGGWAVAHAWRRYPWLFVAGSFTDRIQLTRQLRTGSKSFGLQVTRTVQGTAPVLLIGSLLGPAAVPLYSVPATLVGVVFGVFTSWNANLQPAYGAAWAIGDREWVATAFRRTWETTVLLGTISVAVFAVAGPAVIRVWTHGALDPSAWICLAAAVVALVQASGTAVQFCLAGINQHRRLVAWEAFHTGVAIAGSVMAIAWWGAAGVAVGVAGAYLLWGGWLGFRELGGRLESDAVKPRWWWATRILLVAVAATYLGLLALSLVPATGEITAVGAALAIGLAVGLVIVGGTAAVGVKAWSSWQTWGGAVCLAPLRWWRARSAKSVRADLEPAT